MKQGRRPKRFSDEPKKQTLYLTTAIFDDSWAKVEELPELTTDPGLGDLGQEAKALDGDVAQDGGAIGDLEGVVGAEDRAASEELPWARGRAEPDVGAVRRGKETRKLL